MSSVADTVSDMVDPGGCSLGSEHEPGHHWPVSGVSLKVSTLDFNWHLRPPWRSCEAWSPSNMSGLSVSGHEISTVASKRTRLDKSTCSRQRLTKKCTGMKVLEFSSFTFFCSLGPSYSNPRSLPTKFNYIKCEAKTARDDKNQWKIPTIWNILSNWMQNVKPRKFRVPVVLINSRCFLCVIESCPKASNVDFSF